MSHVVGGDLQGESGAEPRHPARRRNLALLLILLAAGTWFVLSHVAPAKTPGGADGAGTSQVGQASTGGQDRLVVNQTSEIAGLSPGSPPQNLQGTFTNPHSGPLHVSSLTAEVTNTSRPGCPAEDFVIGGSPALVDTAVAPGNDQGSWSGLTIWMRNRPVDQDLCKNSRVTIRYTVQ